MDKINQDNNNQNKDEELVLLQHLEHEYKEIEKLIEQIKTIQCNTKINNERLFIAISIMQNI